MGSARRHHIADADIIFCRHIIAYYAFSPDCYAAYVSF